MSECKRGPIMKFRLANKSKPIIVIKAKVNEGEPLDFVLDTGASTTVLSTQTAKKLGINIKTLPKEKECCGCSGKKMHTRLASVKSIRIGNIEAKDVEVAIMNLTNISKAVGTKLAGIIGYTFMKNYRVVVDYPNENISFTKSSVKSTSYTPNFLMFFNKL